PRRRGATRHPHRRFAHADPARAGRRQRCGARRRGAARGSRLLRTRDPSADRAARRCASAREPFRRAFGRRRGTPRRCPRDGARMMHVETRGHGPDLVLLHGWAMHGGVLASLADALADDFRIHVVDLPGHGSSREETPGGLAITARRIAERIPPAIWLGWSLGGLVALRAALDVPQRVRGLVLIAASPRFVRGPDWPDGVPPEVFAQFAEGLDRDYRATIVRFLALETLGSPHAQSELRGLRAQVFARGEPA